MGPCGHTPYLFPTFLVSSRGIIGYFTLRLGELLVIGGMRLDEVAASHPMASFDWLKSANLHVHQAAIRELGLSTRSW
ncbi:hypothetical protein D623_10010167 [Myotis brandtii]|uniref:Uncharacterized protein n=1 Tax=Myotis brandtii TaxID=109478 RepID=S7NJF3_MYOBR|nr:hypothetical protein D623_10010167 [Myotis brandtii]